MMDSGARRMLSLRSPKDMPARQNPYPSVSQDRVILFAEGVIPIKSVILG